MAFIKKKEQKNSTTTIKQDPFTKSTKKSEQGITMGLMMKINVILMKITGTIVHLQIFYKSKLQGFSND